MISDGLLLITYSMVHHFLFLLTTRVNSSQTRTKLRSDSADQTVQLCLNCRLGQTNIAMLSTRRVGSTCEAQISECARTVPKVAESKRASRVWCLKLSLITTPSLVSRAESGQNTESDASRVCYRELCCREPILTRVEKELHSTHHY